MVINSTDENITIISNRLGVRVIPRGSVHGACVVDAISDHRVSVDNNEDDLEEEIEKILLSEPASIICQQLCIHTEDDVEVVDGETFYQGAHIPISLLRISLERQSDGRFLKLLDRVRKNEISQNPERIYDFVFHNDLPVLEDGRIVAFKSVANNFYDKYSGSVSYYPGSCPKLDLHYVDTRTDSLCSEGLHFCSRHYLHGDWLSNMRIVLLAVSPEDIASVPRYCADQISPASSSKGRARKVESLCALKIGNSDEFHRLNDALKRSTYGNMWEDIADWVDTNLPCSEDIEKERNLSMENTQKEMSGRHYSFASLDEIQSHSPDAEDYPHVERYIVSKVPANESALRVVEESIKPVQEHFGLVFKVSEGSFDMEVINANEKTPYERVLVIDVDEECHGVLQLVPIARAI